MTLIERSATRDANRRLNEDLLEIFGVDNERSLNSEDRSKFREEQRRRRVEYVREELKNTLGNIISGNNTANITLNESLNRQISDFKQAYKNILPNLTTEEALHYMDAIANMNNIQGRQTFFPNSPAINLDNTSKVHYRALLQHINANNTTKIVNGNIVDFGRDFHNSDIIQAFKAADGRNAVAVGFVSGDSSDPRARLKYNVYSNDTERRLLGSLLVPVGNVFGDSLDNFNDYFRMIREHDFVADGPLMNVHWHRDLYYFNQNGEPVFAVGRMNI